MKTKEFNKNPGITLIALVVTILIILILAGVTIATLTGHNGIIKNATVAKQSSEKSAIYEQISIATKSAVSTKTLKINETKFKQALTGIPLDYYENQLATRSAETFDGWVE